MVFLFRNIIFYPPSIKKRETTTIMRSRYALLMIITVISHYHVIAQPIHQCLATKKIVYHSNRAGEVYLVWGINYWKTPTSSLLPKNSVIKNKYAYTPLIKSRNTYSVSIELPCDTRLDYYFYISKDNNGKQVDGWDTNNDNNYNSPGASNAIIELQDANLKFYEQPFSIIKKGKLILAISFIVFLIAMAWFRRTRYLKAYNFLPGFLIAALILVALSRYEIAGLWQQPITNTIGALFPDLLWLVVIFLCTAILLYLFRNRNSAAITLLSCYAAIILLTIIISILNIEVVKQLGTPLSYKWLYYSDFLKGNDAQVGAAKTLTGWYIRNLIALLCSFGFLSVALAIIVSQFRVPKAVRYLLFCLVFLTVIVSYEYYRSLHLQSSKLQAPVFAFVSSLVDPPGKTKMSKMQIPDSVEKYFIMSHNQTINTIYDSLHAINNIIVFVSESTPAQYISLYDSINDFTPALKKWQSISRIYTNMYAHIPSTPNSMLSILSGIYPMIDFRSALLEKVQLPEPSLPQLLESKGWKTSIFFSSDLDYAGMHQYAVGQNFTTIEDNSSIPCNISFHVTQSNIDGLDDSCMVARHLKWLHDNSGENTFSLLWTNQTHNPYYTNNIDHYSTNETLNRYLNALHHTDQVFDQLMTSLSKSGQLEKTLVIFLADHGEAFNTHDQKLHASKVYEENVHIPCILFNPFLFNGSRDGDISGLVDIAPTIAHVLGINKPSEWQGKSLLDNRTNSSRTFFISPYTDLIMGTRHGQWKYIYNVDTEDEELFDLSTDPGELNNRKNMFPQIADQEKEMLGGWLQFVDRKYKSWTKNKN
jgi:phosphoglycerol transferase MdoB-like AlkP superfamily enzyme